MRPCGCIVRLGNENSVCYEGLHTIVYCPLHANAERMKEFIEKVIKEEPHDRFLFVQDEAIAILKDISNG